MQITVGMVKNLIGGPAMSWLDDMEPADPAYRDPEADPWAAPDYAPDTSRGLPAEVGAAIGEWARQQNARTPAPELGRPSADNLAEDPWAQPPDAGQQPPVPAVAAQARSGDRTFTIDEAYRVAEDAVGLFLEYRDTHTRSEADARIEALGEVAQGLHAWADADEAISPQCTTGRDWLVLRAAESPARYAGLRASVPQPVGQESPQYQAEAAAWGTGRGIGPDEPEVG